MKSIIAATAAFFLSLGCYAQDMIVKKDGSVIQAKVMKVGTTEVDYKKWSNQDGPSYAIAKSDILAITYQNGEKETFEIPERTAIQDNTISEPSEPVLRPATEDNATVIAKYNKIIALTKPKKIGKIVDSAIGIFGFDDNSILSNDDIEVSFRLCKEQSPWFKKRFLMFRYSIILKNKTGKTLYVDLSNCSRNHREAAKSILFYTGESTSITQGNSGRVGVGVAGIIPGVSVGISGGSSSATTHSYLQQRIIKLQPNGSVMLRDFKYVDTKQTVELVSQGEEYAFGYMSAAWGYWGNVDFQPSGINKGIIKENEVIQFNSTNSPLHLDYTFLYSDKSDFSNQYIINMGMYLRELIGKATNGVKGPYHWWSEAGGCLRYVDILQGYDEYTICGPIKFD